MTAAALATLRLAAGLGAAADTLRAEFAAARGGPAASALGGFNQLDLDNVFEVGDPGRFAAAAEDSAKYVVEEATERIAGGRGTNGIAETGMAISIVALPFLGIAQYLVGFRCLAELGLGVLVPAVAVGVITHGLLAVRLLDRLVVGVLGDLKNFVEVSFVCHELVVLRSAFDRLAADQPALAKARG